MYGNSVEFWVEEFRFRADSAETVKELEEFRQEIEKKAIADLTSSIRQSLDDEFLGMITDEFYTVYVGGTQDSGFNRFSYAQAKNRAYECSEETDGEEDVWIDAITGDTVFEIEASRDLGLIDDLPDDGT